MKNFVYNSPSSSCACRIICMQEIYQSLAKKVTNMDIWSKWMWQEALGPLGITTQPPRWPYHITDLLELLLKQSKSSIQGGLINGQHLFMVDSWGHCHTLGSLQPPYQPTYCMNFDMCCKGNYLWEPTSTIGCKGGAS